MLNSQSVAHANRQVIINDASCLIDLHKVDLLSPMLALPYDFHVALPVRFNELLSIAAEDWAHYERLGMQTIDLAPSQVGKALTLREMHPALSAEDCLSLVLAQETRGSLLLTGDAALREVAETTYRVEVHGVLWAADRLVENELISGKVICECLEKWDNDPLVRLPSHLIKSRIRRWREQVVAVTVSG